MTVRFSSRFDTLADFERGVYLVAFLGAAAASVLLIAPSAIRQFLRHEHRQDLQPFSARLAIAGLAALGIALIAVVNLICDILYGLAVAAVVTVAVAGLVLVLWFAFPMVRRSGVGGGESTGDRRWRRGCSREQGGARCCAHSSRGGSMTRKRTLALILGGGAGSRMGALTEARAKPSLSFAGVYRLVDFPLSNCANSGIDDVWLIEQYQPYTLEDHVANGRPWDLDRTMGGLLILHPFTGSDEGGFPEGNADALWRHHRLIAEFDPDVAIVLSADAVYTFDYRDLVDAHLAADADLTMATTTVDGDAGRFGVVTTAADGRVQDFSYKPSEPESDLVTIEVFAYRPSALLGTLEDLVHEGQALSDFGDALVPRLVSQGRAFEYRFDRYWRDLGTPEAYWQAHQDLLNGDGPDLQDQRWPVRTTCGHQPPARVTRAGSVNDSLVSPACLIEGRVVDSVLSSGVVVEPGAVVDRSVILQKAVIRSGAHVEAAIVDARVEVAANATVRGGDPDTPVAVVTADGGSRD